MSVISNLSSFGMAVGPPLVYLDQYVSILRRKDSSGFSMDVCGVLIVANVLRIFFWFAERFEVALLVQSILMIAFQLALLYVCLKYQNPLIPLVHQPGRSTNATTALLSNEGTSGAKRRPYNLWQWESYGTYIEFVAAVIGLNTVLYVMLSGFQTYVDVIGLLALGLESTLPIPQLLSNFQRKSLAGFRVTVLAGWLFGDAFKTVYFFAQEGNSWQFKATACFQLSIDLMILAQAWLYRHNTAAQASGPVPQENSGDLSGSRSPRESIEIHNVDR